MDIKDLPNYEDFKLAAQESFSVLWDTSESDGATPDQFALLILGQYMNGIILHAKKTASARDQAIKNEIEQAKDIKALKNREIALRDSIFPKSEPVPDQEAEVDEAEAGAEAATDETPQEVQE